MDSIHTGPSQPIYCEGLDLRTLTGLTPNYGDNLNALDRDGIASVQSIIIIITIIIMIIIASHDNEMNDL